MSSSLAGLAAYTLAARGHSMPVNLHHADPLTPPAPCPNCGVPAGFHCPYPAECR